jgi:hypothetical protein
MSDTELLIRDTLTEYAEQADLVDLVAAAKAQSRRQSRATRAIHRPRWSATGWWSPRRFVAVGVATCLGLVAAAFVLGGGPRYTAQHVELARPRLAPLEQRANGPASGLTPRGARKSARGYGLSGSAPNSTKAPNQPTRAGGGLGATRVVKTGSLGLSVDKGQVAATITKLVGIATSLGGYASQTQTDASAGSPSGEVTMRMPVSRFDDAVSQAQRLGHQTSLSTNAQDVTGKYVDLGARLSALQHVRSTYLTILGRARTIGATLSVQQRIDNIQQEIEQVQGKLKVLRNQSNDGTLTVDVTQRGAPVVKPAPHKPSGIGKAWHTSIDRFSHGFDAIVAALGPLALALLVVGFIAMLGWLGVRQLRRHAAI